jgi:heme-degrading monooxygenase HmoA
VLKPLAAGDPYVIQTLWESRADFIAWTKSEEFVAGHARTPELPPEAFSAPTKLEVHEVFQQTNWRNGARSNGSTGQN